MSAVLHPVGPATPRVYWVRRLVVIGVVVVVVAVLWAVLSGVAKGAAETPADVAADDAAADAASGDGTEPAVVDAAAPQACTAADLTLTLTTTTRAYVAPEAPVFAVAITNSGAASCTLDAGGTAQEIVITSGSDRIWSSADCPVESPERLLLLAPGDRDEVQVTWPRVRSAPGCTTGLPEPRVGTYSAVLTLLGAQSAAAVFDLG
jgi:hypothetical protein